MEEKNKRPPPRSIRIPKKWEAEVERRWKRSGLSFSEFILVSILQAEYVPKTRGVSEEKEILTDGVSALIEIKTEIQGIAVTDEGVAIALKGVDDRLAETRNLLMGKAGYTT
jgi:hypothetical protein